MTNIQKNLIVHKCADCVNVRVVFFRVFFLYIIDTTGVLQVLLSRLSISLMPAVYVQSKQQIQYAIPVNAMPRSDGGCGCIYTVRNANTPDIMVVIMRPNGNNKSY